MKAIKRASDTSSLESVIAHDYLEQPYWWDAASPVDEQLQTVPLPSGTVDAVIIGSGITGVVAALKLARAGSKVIVIDMQAIGEGAARRNAGYIGRTLKRSVSWLERELGPGRGAAIYKELNAALVQVGQLISDEHIRCYHELCGRFIAANSPAHFKLLIDDLEDMRRRLGFTYHAVGKADMSTELASDRYFGGAVIPDLGSIHPGLYHKGLVEKARAAGVEFQPHTEVFSFTGGDGVKKITTSRGTLQARHLAVTTNGYTTPNLDWHARRVVPFRGFVIATEILPRELIDRVLPKRRTYLDTKMNIDFIRTAPDSERILFGGMTGSQAPTATAMVPALYKRLTTILPDLKGVRISRAWLGQCAGTMDFMPHIGVQDDVHYAMGYNFAGVPIGTSFGAKIAARILRHNDTESEFDTRSFAAIPFYNGSPWFVPWVMKYFDWQDRRVAGEHADTML
jgi:glycine/D-amino acid oxidase-like deaminating enzyme